ncbi:MAG: ABC transporter ATP-binding protein [Brevefilum sp.]|nr:ABC transporter ATP-binding protein [Brevefilum sp.]
MTDIAIKIENVHKFYGKVHALRGLNLEVMRGEIFGFLGPNGAGKTTTIRCMLDLLRPSTGEIRVLDINPQRSPQAVKDKVGYLPGDLKLEGDFTARDFFKHIRKLRGSKRAWEDILNLAERLDLDLDRKIKTLSQGNKQKVGLIQCFLSNVPLILLDEPTLGLDPLMKQEILNIIREQKEEGKTVFFSSHILSEVQKVADRVGIIRKGRLVEIANTADLIGRSLTRAIVQFDEVVTPTAFEDVSNVDILRVNDNNRAYTLQIRGEMNGLIKALAEYPVLDLEITKPSLEEVFLNYYEDNGSEE